MRLTLILGHRKELQLTEVATERRKLRLRLVPEPVGNLLRLVHIVAIELLTQWQRQRRRLTLFDGQCLLE